MHNKTLVITSIPQRYYSYFQWFLLGFYMLDEKADIHLKFKMPILSTIFNHCSNRYVLGFLSRLISRFYTSNNDYYLEGYYFFEGRKRTFCIDCADAPNAYDSERLISCDLYFKMQCPKKFDKRGFPLTSRIYLPWLDNKWLDINNKLSGRLECKEVLFKNIHKVRPLMVGPRMLSRSNTFKSLTRAFNDYRDSLKNEKEMLMMCYFGDSKGPNPIDIGNATKPNLAHEHVIVGYFKNRISHPNEKRKIAADIMKEMGSGYDARIINEGNADMGQKSHPELIVPLNQFCNHISSFKYNLNISGYTRSVPNRFIESFMVGTAIVTDVLALQWYQPFNEEVIETVEMGYLRNDEVDWETFKKQIAHLPTINKTMVEKNFNAKWHPCKVAGYIIEELSRC